MHALEVIAVRNAAAAGREAAHAVDNGNHEEALRIARAADPRVHSSFLRAYWKERHPQEGGK